MMYFGRRSILKLIAAIPFIKISLPEEDHASIDPITLNCKHLNKTAVVLTRDNKAIRYCRNCGQMFPYKSRLEIELNYRKDAKYLQEFYKEEGEIQNNPFGVFGKYNDYDFNQ